MRFADVTTTSSVPAAPSKRVQADPSSAPSEAAPAGPCGPAGPCAPAGPAGPAGPAWPAAPAAPAGPIGPAGPTAPAAPVSPFGPWRPAGPGAPAGPAAPCAPAGPRSFHVTMRSFLRQSDASRTTRRNPLPGFWQPTITPSALAPAPANAVALATANAVTQAMTIARPYTSRSLRRCRRPSYPRPARAARCPNGTCALDSAWLSGDVDTPAPTRDEGWSASARI